MENEDKTIEHEDLAPSTEMNNIASTDQETQEETVMNLKGSEGNEPTEGSNLLSSSEKRLQETPTESTHLQRLRQTFACPPRGLLDRVITNVTILVLLWAVVWSITGSECLPGGNLFGIIILFYCTIFGGKLLGLIKLPTLPPLPPLLGMLLAGFLIRNIPVVNDNVQIKHKWSSALRSIALSVILVRAGLGLDPQALRKLKGVCVRLAMGPCLVEACSSALLAHFLMGLPWQWGFILGFVLGAVSPAVVVPSMLLLQEGGYGVEKGVPTLLMAAGSFDDILAITGFNTCLGMAFSTAWLDKQCIGCTWDPNWPTMGRRSGTCELNHCATQPAPTNLYGSGRALFWGCLCCRCSAVCILVSLGQEDCVRCSWLSLQAWDGAVKRPRQVITHCCSVSGLISAPWLLAERSLLSAFHPAWAADQRTALGALWPPCPGQSSQSSLREGMPLCVHCDPCRASGSLPDISILQTVPSLLNGNLF
ncbi:sodium/hydrogen exchanger 9B2-like isoform X2 [Equus asinus]|uniref:sodium/hydrogen exchanger 9B2-like isoform X2 n=1 Tax=Equus asinus TaxID=9793 RepID=UPI0038F6CD47